MRQSPRWDYIRWQLAIIPVLLGALFVACGDGAKDPPSVAPASPDNQAEYAVVYPDLGLVKEEPVPTPKAEAPAEPPVTPPEEPAVLAAVEDPVPESALPVEPDLPPPPPDLCADVISLNVTDAALRPAVDSAIDLWTDVFGCVKVQVDGQGAVIRFGDECWPGERITACTRRGLTPVEVHVNPACWLTTGEWPRAFAHEIGHVLGYADLDGNPYMTSSPPRPGTHYRSDGVVVC